MEALKPAEMSPLEKLRWGSQNLPVRQKLVCDYLLKNFQQAVFMTVEEVSKQSGLSPSTVVRAVAGLGFESYHALQQALQSLLISSKASLWWQMEDSWSDAGEESSGREGEGSIPAGAHSFRAHMKEQWEEALTSDSEKVSHPLVQATRDNIEALTQSLTPLLFENFETAVGLLEKANRIFLFGMRSSQGITRYGFSLLHQFMSNIYMVDRAGSEEMFDDLIDLAEGDCLLALSYGGPHYASRTFDVLHIAKSMGIPIILMTTELSNPAAPLADAVLCVSPARNHYTMAPALTVLEALVIELGKRSRTQAMRKLRKLEKILGEKGVTL
jgi:DNA-binding MurR/RpiR family transcriptional regulator